MLGDGDDADALAPEHGPEGHGVLPLAGEAAELPDQDHLEGGGGLPALVDHRPELGAVGDAAALGLVHVLAGYGVAVVLGIVPERPELGSQGDVHVLASAGDPSVQGRRGERCTCLFMLSSLAIDSASFASFNLSVRSAATPVRTSRRPGRTISR